MKRKKLEIVKSSTYRRFFFSYVWVLIIPIMAFTLIYTQYYEKMYKKKILEQSEKALELSMQELQSRIVELNTISIQNSLLAIAKGYNLKRDVMNIQIKNLLASQTITHSFIESIDYYNEVVPNRVYTQQGTYAPKYYRQYIKQDGSLCFLPQYLSELESSGWISSRNIVWDSYATESYLQYVVKIGGSDKSYWIFTISNDGLRKLLDTEEAVTILYNNKGDQLYPFEEVSLERKEQVEVMELSHSGSNIGNGSIQLYSSMSNESLKLVRMIRSDYLFLESNQFRAIFLLVVMLLLILGGILVATLSFYNNRPINELEIFCENKFGDIPKDIKGLDVFRFTLDKMEEKVILLEQNQKVERLLLQMIYGKNCNTNYFKERMINSGLFINAERYRVIYVYPNDDAISFNLPVYFEMLLDNEYELHILEYAKQNVIIGIIGMNEANEQQLKGRLNAITAKISEINSEGINICVGGSCDRVEDIHWSYMQALMVSHKIKKQENGSVNYFEENANMKIRFMYPKLELDSLYDALIVANFKKASLITDVLVDTIREQSYNRFVCTALCYDVINAYYRAQTELEFQNKDSEPKIDSKLINGITDIEEMITIILQVRDKSRAYMEKGSQEVQPKDIATKVIAFIDQNSKDRNLSVSMVADTFQMSISNLSHQFKALTNMNISDYITDKKFIYVKELLLDTDYSVQKVSDLMGYNQTTSFIRKFKQYYGMTPSEFRVFYQKEQPGTMNNLEQKVVD